MSVPVSALVTPRPRLARAARLSLALGVAWSLAAGCGSDGGDPGVAPEPRPAPVASVIVTPDPIVLALGFTVQLTASPRDAKGGVLPGRAIAWSTSDASVAQVSASGEVTGVREGSVRIAATSEGTTGSVDITLVFLPVASVDVAPRAATLATGATLQLTGKPLSNTGEPLPQRVVTWSSSDPATATVSATGLVTAVAAGTASVTATSEGRTKSAQITVGPAGVRAASRSRSP